MPRTIAVNTWVWTSPLTDDTLEPLARTAARMGYDALELPLESIGDWDPLRARAVLDGLGMGAVVVGAMGPGRSLLARAGDVAATQDYLRACLDAAAVLGAAVVAGPFYAPTGVTWRMDETQRAEVVGELRDNLAPLAREAAAIGVTLAVEPLNRYETSVLNTVAQSLDALAPLLGAGVGLALDTYHLNIEEKRPADAVRAAGAAIAHVQVCGSDRGAVGDDHTDWPEMLRALDDAGYRGVLGLESFTGENATIAVAASVWRPLAASQDDLAARSIAHLRALGA
ncbi:MULTISPECIES: sugar phosphate isomerase/epimerase family protein [unclassified Microbacterium]|nr:MULTISPECIES: sugar phosphate isomerase/epimerase family protein [unclassified Microbacterium]MDH5133113.1 sugar phosphate isomerase/epimerase [Microbacterium sp. RD10]MDH5136528.1 sugar phosphate isomerase/epimerase [Microbacterium sp. RD11]MDH5144638.1 sugar phosphate isomerase/epimerase [Microbacterium sp. RD12]MDH5154653.1 sugar phosphate isomerase/epimerase [Microbacterium sp. RD06]MDH5165169.1 sugar phosphate isomerase/epimerase [Microbacterium sp. RD02]